MITAADESLLHQVAETFDNTPVSDHRFFDRVVVGMHAPDGSRALLTSFGVYKNTNVMDGFVMVQEDARRQFNHRYSRRLRPNVDGMVLGPLSMEVIEPLKRLRVKLEKGDYPASYDIEWTAALPPHEEPRHLHLENGRIVRNHLRFDQFGTANGWLEIEGRRTEVRDWFAWRDHSWGVRAGVGGHEAVNDHPNPASGLFRLYCWWLTEEAGGFFQHHEDGQGKRLFLSGVVDYRDGRPSIEIEDIQHEVTFVPGTRVFDTAKVWAKAGTGETFEIEAKNIGRPWLFKGSGYDHGYNDEKGLGVWRGDWLEEYDIYDVSDPEAAVLPDGRVVRPVHREQLTAVTVNGKPGFAHFPLINNGRIERYKLGM